MVQTMTRASSRACRIVALVFGLASGWSTACAQPLAQPRSQLREQPLAPQGLWFSRRGLDAKNNKIDELISKFGFICWRNPLHPRPCRIETELVSLLRSFFPNQTVILRELRALGATCRGDDRRLACVVERTVEETIWAGGHPPRLFEHRILIGFLVEETNGALGYSATFDKTEAQKFSDQP